MRARPIAGEGRYRARVAQRRRTQGLRLRRLDRAASSAAMRRWNRLASAPFDGIRNHVQHLLSFHFGLWFVFIAASYFSGRRAKVIVDRGKQSVSILFNIYLYCGLCPF